MQHPRSPYYKTYPRSPRQVAICARRIASRLLVPEANESDPQVDSFLGYLDNRYADNAEDDCNAKVSKAARDYMRAGWMCHDGETQVIRELEEKSRRVIERWVARVKGGYVGLVYVTLKVTQAKDSNPTGSFNDRSDNIL